MLKTPTDARERMYMYTTEASHSHIIKGPHSKPVYGYVTWSWINTPIPYKEPLTPALQIISCQLHIMVPTTPPYVVGFRWAVQMDPTCRQWPQTRWHFHNCHDRLDLATNSMTSVYLSYQYQNYVRQGVLWISNRTLSLSTTNKGPHWSQVDETPTGTYT